ncbi:MAG: hypothetical protein ACRED5_06565 [Propylenella sp.]
MQHLRFLALYGWLEPFDLAKHPEALVRLVEDARITPTKVTVAIPGEKKSRRRTIYKRSRLIDVIAPFTSYDWIALDEPIEGDFRDVRSHLSFQLDCQRYLLAKEFSAFTLADVVSHLRLVCEFATPRYGFLHSEYGLAALAFPWGTPTTGLPAHVSRRVGDLGHSIRSSHEHLNGKLHDVYEVNVLSPLHLERQVRGLSLRDWIGEGGRGDILTIKSDLFAWIVPGDFRPKVRAILFDDGALIATV